MPLRAAADHQFAAGQLGAHAQLRYPGDAEAFQGHAFQAVGHGGLIDGGKAQLTLTQKTIYRAPEKRPGAVRQQRYADVTFQIEQRLTLGIRRTHREHLGLAQVQRREDFRIHLHRCVRVVERQHQVAAAFAQRVHRVADVGRDQPCGDVQPFIAQLRNPAREEAQRQRVRGRDLHHFALPAFQVMQVAQHFAELFDHGARGHQKQLPGRRQFDRRARAVDQRQAQRRFEAADPPTERRLGHEAPFGRLREAAGGGQGTEVLEPFAFQIHHALPGTHQNRSHVCRAGGVTRALCRMCIGQCLTALAQKIL